MHIGTRRYVFLNVVFFEKVIVLRVLLGVVVGGRSVYVAVIDISINNAILCFCIRIPISHYYIIVREEVGLLWREVIVDDIVCCGQVQIVIAR